MRIRIDIVAASLLIATCVAAAIPPAERNALVALYEATNGAEWRTRTGWLGSEGSECQWFGVTCNSDGTAVTRIDLSANRLAGTLPAEIGNLESLESLWLYDNDLSGTIPGLLGQLSPLWYLRLSQNRLSGTIPAELGNLSAMLFLDLSENQLSGDVPSELGNLASLRRLVLRENSLSGSIPPALGNLVALRDLELDCNTLSGTLPAELGTLIDLQTLKASDNELTGTIPPELGSLAKLGELSIAWNRLTGTIPKELANLDSLLTLRARSNKLSGTIPEELAALEQLGYLALSRNDLTGTVPNWLTSMDRLSAAFLSDLDLHGEIPHDIGDMDNLGLLLLDGNRLTGTIPSSIGSLTQLQILVLSDNRLSGTLPVELANLDQLTSLSLDRNQLVGEVPQIVAGKLKTLRNLRMGYNALSSSDPDLARILDIEHGGSFVSTQTLPPDSVKAEAQGDGAWLVRWRPIAFTSFGGGYQVMTSTSEDGPYVVAGETFDKTASSLLVEGLPPGPAFFQVRAITAPHPSNQGTVLSKVEDGLEGAGATTGSPGSLELSSATYRASEGGTKAIVIRRLGGVSGQVSVQAAFAGVTATVGSDFADASQTLIWSDGDTTPRQVEVTVVDDALPEGEETVAVSLSSPTGGATLGAVPAAELTLDDNDLVEGGEARLASGGYSPTVSVDAVGNRVVVWAEPGADGDGTGIVAQRFDPSGNSTGPQIHVNATTAGNQHSAAVSHDGSGRFIVVWVDETDSKRFQPAPGKLLQTGAGVLGRVFDPTGAPEGNEFVVDTSNSGVVTSPAIAVDPVSGRFVVVWGRGVPAKERLPGSTVSQGPAGVFGRFFDPSGAPAGSELTIDDGSGGDAGEPAVAVDTEGDVVVAWTRAGSSGWRDVFARRIATDGTPAGPDIAVNTETWRDQSAPSVMTASGSGFTVLWQGPSLPDEEGVREGGTDVYGQGFDASGDRRGETFRVNVDVADTQADPIVESTGDGDCWAAWSTYDELGVAGVFGRFLPDCDGGGKLFGEVPLSPAGGASVRTPSAAVGPSGEVTVVYVTDDTIEGDGGVAGVALGAPAPVECSPGATTMCLNGSRFSVEVVWRDFQDNTGSGQAVQLTGDTGYFWFFDQSNVELVVKVLDGTAINGHYWVFYGALSNVEYTITVTDSTTGATRTYFNPLGTFGSDGDTAALPSGGRGVGVGPATGRGQPRLGLDRAARTAPIPNELRSDVAPKNLAASCSEDGETLCLNVERFSVQVSWRDFQGNAGEGQAVPLTGDTGTFWFFDDNNIELVVKVLDGRGINQHFWVFYGALSNVEYTLTVTDSETGAVRTYTNPLGGFASMGDAEAFFVP